jgi:DNA-binding MarR family transcriptional regulator
MANMSTTPPNEVDPGAPWLTATEQEAWRAFVNGARRLMDRLEQDLKALGISHDDYAVLVVLSEAPDDRLRMAELADESVQSRSRMSHHIGRLESRGLVRRESCPDDRRGFNAILTDEGRALIEATAPHHVTGVRRWFLDQVEPDELEVVRRVFRRIDDALGPEGRCPGDIVPCATDDLAEDVTEDAADGATDPADAAGPAAADAHA